VNRWTFIGSLLVCLVLFWIPLAVVLTHCASTQAEQQQAAAASYATQQIDCVVRSSTRAQADSCRAQVWQLYCGPGAILDDAGACEADGGR
jgi:hypothetical protein